MGSKGSQQVQTNQNQTYGPDPNAYASIYGALQGAQGVAQTPFHTPAAPVAGFSDQQRQAFDATGAAQGYAQPYIQQASQYFSPQGTQQFLNPYTANVTANLQDIFGKQMSQTTGNLTQQAGGVGADRIAVGQSELAKQQGLAAGQTYAGLYNNAAQQAQTAAFGTANLGTAGQNAQLQGAQALLGTGGLQQQLSQAQLNSPYQQQLQQIAWPYQNAQFLAGITGALAPGMGGTTTGSGATTYPGASPWGSIAGLGMAGLGAYGIGNQQGWWGSPGGAQETPQIAEGPMSGSGGMASARGGRINPFYAPGGAVDDSDSVPQIAGVDDRLLRSQEMQQLAGGASASPQNQPIRLPSGVSGQPIDMAPKSIIPQEQLTSIKPTIPQINTTPPQQQSGGGGKGGGMDMGTLLKTGMTVAAMFGRGGAARSPFEIADVKRDMEHVFGRGGRTNAFAEGGDVLNFEDRAQPVEDAIADSTFDAAGKNFTPFTLPAESERAPESAPRRRVSAADGDDDGGLTDISAQSRREVESADQEEPRGRETAAGPPSMANSPWMALMSAGLGTMAAAGQRDARGLPMSPLAAVGHGGLQGIKTLQEQQAAGQKQQSIEQASRRLDQAAEFHQDEYTKMKPHEQATVDIAREAAKRAQQFHEDPYNRLTAEQRQKADETRRKEDRESRKPFTLTNEYGMPAGSFMWDDAQKKYVPIDPKSGATLPAQSGQNEPAPASKPIQLALAEENSPEAKQQISEILRAANISVTPPIPDVKGATALDHPLGDKQLNEAAIADLSPGDRAVLRMMTEGKIAPPSSYALTKPYWNMMLKKAALYDPDLNFQTWGARAQAYKDMTSGVTARNIVRPMNTVANHLDRLDMNQRSINDEFYHSNQLGLFTGAGNAFQKWKLENRQDPRLTAIEADVTIISNELEKAFKGSNPAVTGIHHWRDVMKGDASPEQKATANREFVNLIYGQLDSVTNQWQRAFGATVAAPDFLSPKARAAFEKLGGGGDAPAAPDYRDAARRELLRRQQQQQQP